VLKELALTLTKLKTEKLGWEKRGFHLAEVRGSKMVDLKQTLFCLLFQILSTSCNAELLSQSFILNARTSYFFFDTLYFEQSQSNLRLIPKLMRRYVRLERLLLHRKEPASQSTALRASKRIAKIS